MSCTAPARPSTPRQTRQPRTPAVRRPQPPAPSTWNAEQFLDRTNALIAEATRLKNKLPAHLRALGV